MAMTDPEGSTAVANTSTVSEDGGGGGGASADVEHDPYFEPVVSLPEIQVKTNEEEEDEMVKLRCKLFRYNTLETPAEWKERGTGDVKILKHSKKKTVRVLMRQDKTLKIRANHYITPFMELKPNCGSDRAWVWSVPADFADEEPKQELFAVRFANAQNASLFKEKFDEARGIVTVAEVKGQEDSEEKKEPKNVSAEAKETSSSTPSGENAVESVAKDLEKMNVKKADADVKE
ncbi:ran-specific GTPase-activating protein-like isoform X2 [Palaemon carinicauda]|uniref:ran-specific GTPase-activating protein-like isoform X2 n=1 Tax=Palaemon carinicauda TaxID=392227 RepID=UPI0035B600FE